MRVLIVVQIVTLIIGLGAIYLTVKASESDRIGARRDTCELIVGLARAAAGTSAKAERAANAYIARTPLRDCNAYAHQQPGRKPIPSAHTAQ